MVKITWRTMSSLFSLAPLTPAAATALGLEGVGLDRLHVPGLGHDDDEFLVVDEVLDRELAGVVGELAHAGRRELLLDGGHLGLDDAPQLHRVGQDRRELGDALAQLAELGLEVDAGEPGEAGERHVEDVLGLHLGELERRRDEPAPGVGLVVGGPDGGDDLRRSR